MTVGGSGAGKPALLMLAKYTVDIQQLAHPFVYDSVVFALFVVWLVVKEH